jgi:chain length determinant protein tyrosine kinase EpsG
MNAFSQAIPVIDGADEVEANAARRRPIGTLIRDACELSGAQIERILVYQRERGLRFGEAAVALRMAERQDVLEALSKQFDYTSGFAGREGDSELVAAVDPFSDQAEAFRELRSRLLLEVMRDGPRCALAVVSPEVGDGKTYLAANLAVAFSQLGERTLLVDADIRTPRLHSLLHLGYRAGLSSLLAGFADAAETVHPVPGVPNLFLLPAGAVPPNPVELLHRPVFGTLVRDMLEAFDHVVLDTPAAIRGADSRAIAARAGAALVVARKARSRMEALEGLVAALGRGSARIAGVVMNEH